MTTIWPLSEPRSVSPGARAFLRAEDALGRACEPAAAEAKRLPGSARRLLRVVVGTALNAS